MRSTGRPRPNLSMSIDAGIPRKPASAGDARPDAPEMFNILLALAHRLLTVRDVAALLRKSPFSSCTCAWTSETAAGPVPK
jgi:hypothetical protein